MKRLTVHTSPGEGIHVVKCPALACRRQVTVALGADRAKCPSCGLEWPLDKSHLLMGKRGARCKT